MDQHVEVDLELNEAIETTPKFIQRILMTSLVVFIAAWLIPKIPWRPKRIEDYLKFYRLLFEAFRTWSMISTALTTLIIFAYFLITGAYNWRRQYTKSTQNQKAEQAEIKSENEKQWEELRNSKIIKRKLIPKRLEFNKKDMAEFLESIKVFEYLEGESLQSILEGAYLKNVTKSEEVTVNETDLIFVTFGSFKATFIDSTLNSKSTNGFTITCTRGKTLTSYGNVMRAFAKYYNNSTISSTTTIPLPDRTRNLSVTIVSKEDDSQILVLNEACFTNLALKSKLSVAHLTQVILSRFKRATIPIIFDYFNLTGTMSSFLGYFLKKSQGLDDVKLADMLLTCQETIKTKQEDKLLRVILQYLIASFGLDHSQFSSIEGSIALLQKHIEIKVADSDEIIQAIGQECKGAFLIIEGNLKFSFTNEKDKNKNVNNSLEATIGDFVGIISALMGKCSAIQVQCSSSNSSNAAKSPSVTYAVISQHLIEMISERDPKILFANIPDNRNTNQFIEFVDMCIDWQQCDSGEPIITEEKSTNYIVKILHGRVREIYEQSQREFGSGSFLGEQGIFSEYYKEQESDNLKSLKLVTIRQSEIATFPVKLIEGLIILNAQVATSLLPKLLARQRTSQEEPKRSVDPIKTICILPIGIDRNKSSKIEIGLNVQRNGQVRLAEEVSEGLQRALKRHRTNFTVIDGVRATELMGRQLFTTLGTLKMNEFLSSQEDVSKIIIYVADGIFSNWTRQCISQADLVLLVADLDDEVIGFGDSERQMLQLNPLINTELCLISCKPNRSRADSRKWLKHRPWIKAHFQLSCPNHVHLRTPHPHKHSNNYNYNLKLSVMNMVPLDLLNSIARKSRDLRSYLMKDSVARVQDIRRGSIFCIDEGEDENDLRGFGRLGRRILGKSFGLVLGGGGARGLAHLGIVKALKEAGVQIDLIGGTSIGAFIGGLLAREGGLNDYQRTLQAIEGFCRAMSSKWRQALDLTYPATSWFTGHGFNRALWKYFGFSGIEDFSIPFFAVTTDLTRSRLQVHRAGPAWKYIRASMSLSGFLPPVCDARDGTLLVDGGYLANVPIEVMLKGSLTELSDLTINEEIGDEFRDALSAAIVLAIDVGRASDRVPIFYGDSLSGWMVLFQKFKRYMSTWSLTNRPPYQDLSESLEKQEKPPLTLDEIQFRLAYASSAGLLSRTLKRNHIQLASELRDKPVPYVTVEGLDEITLENNDISDFPLFENIDDDYIISSNLNKNYLPEVIYLRPSGTLQYGTLEFKKWKEILCVGYEYGKELIQDWKENGLLDKILKFQGNYIVNPIEEEQEGLIKTQDKENLQEQIFPCRMRRSSI